MRIETLRLAFLRDGDLLVGSAMALELEALLWEPGGPL